MATDPLFNVALPDEPEQFRTLKDFVPTDTNPQDVISDNIIQPPVRAYDPYLYSGPEMDYSPGTTLSSGKNQSQPSVVVTSPSYKWFTVTQGSAVGFVNVEPGRIYVTPTHNLEASANAGLLDTPLELRTTAAVTELAVSTGMYVCVRLTWSRREGQTGFGRLVSGEGATSVAAPYTGDSTTYEPAVASMSKIQQNEVASASIVATLSPAVTTVAYQTDIIIAEIVIAGGAMTIKQRHDGALVIPTPFYTGKTNMPV